MNSDTVHSMEVGGCTSRKEGDKSEFDRGATIGSNRQQPEVGMVITNLRKKSLTYGKNH